MVTFFWQSSQFASQTCHSRKRRSKRTRAESRYLNNHRFNDSINTSIQQFRKERKKCPSPPFRDLPNDRSALLQYSDLQSTNYRSLRVDSAPILSIFELINRRNRINKRNHMFAYPSHIGFFSSFLCTESVSLQPVKAC